mgnify:CR=1 FL=1|jgi:hypothetical protein
MICSEEDILAEFERVRDEITVWLEKQFGNEK